MLSPYFHSANLLPAIWARGKGCPASLRKCTQFTHNTKHAPFQHTPINPPPTG